MRLTVLFSLIAICMQLLPASASATLVPRPIGNEQRIKVINYMPNTVFRFVGHYFYQTIIEFADHESISTISMGTPTPWQIVPAGNRIFIKPIADHATTNMTVITDSGDSGLQRMYFFEMHAREAQSITDPDLAFVVKFIYPDEDGTGGVKQVGGDTPPDLSRPELYNFDYALSGDAPLIEPLLIFDDGQFTYFKFRDLDADLPAFFLVDSKRNEAIVNYRIAHGYVVIERVSPRFTLRHGNQVLCVFNQRMEQDLKRAKVTRNG